MRLPVPLAAPRRLLVAVVVAALAGPLLAGCSALVPGQGAEATASAAPPAAPPSQPQGQGGTSPGGGSGSGSADACQVTITGPGSIQVGGASSRVVTVNGASSVTCGDGPALAIGPVADGAITLTAAGGAPVEVAVGQSAAVGPYRVSVSSADGSAARFVVDTG